MDQVLKANWAYILVGVVILLFVMYAKGCSDGKSELLQAAANSNQEAKGGNAT